MLLEAYTFFIAEEYFKSAKEYKRALDYLQSKNKGAVAANQRYPPYDSVHHSTSRFDRTAQLIISWVARLFK